MADSDALHVNERSLQLSVAEASVRLDQLVDATPREAGMQLIRAFARKPSESWGAHQIAAHARVALISAHLSRERTASLSDRIEMYVADGLGWLIARGLIGPAAEHSGDPKWRPTTDGLRTAQDGTPARAEATLRLHAELHPSIDESVRFNFEKGDYALAVLAATRAVEIAVRDAAALDGDQYGVKLMRAAFSPSPNSGPLTADAPVSEQEGIRDLFTGVVSAFRNPLSHTDVEYSSPIEAADIIHMADLLLRIVDSARLRKEAAARHP